MDPERGYTEGVNVVLKSNNTSSHITCFRQNADDQTDCRTTKYKVKIKEWKKRWS